MARVQQRDGAALDALLERHGSSLHGYLYRMNGNAADTEEVCQETFLRVWHHAQRWEPGRVRFSTWLFRIGHNLCIDRFRKQRPFVDAALPEPEDPAADPVAGVQHEQQVQAVRGAVAALPDRQRSALLLCHFQGLSNKHAAEVLEVSVEALESLLSRARRSLKKTLSAQGGFDG